MKVGGIDCGSSLKKFAWRDDMGGLSLMCPSSPEVSLGAMRDSGVTTLRITGLGELPEGLDGFEVCRSQLNRINEEHRLQVAGARELLTSGEGMPLKDFLLVSIGSGVSYTFVYGDSIVNFPFGNPRGATEIYGDMLVNGSEIPPDYYLELPVPPPGNVGHGVPLDLLMRDLMPELTDHYTGKYVASHGAGFKKGIRLEDYAASKLNALAVQVVRDIAITQLLGNHFPNVVFVGTPIVRFPRLFEFMLPYQAELEVTFHVPRFAQFAGAVGALLAGEKNI